MSDAIKHECGVAFIRLRKPLSYFKEKYGSYWYGLHKLQFMMTKQLNRGQDGAGIGVVKLQPQYGDRYLARQRSASKTALGDIFEEVFKALDQIPEEHREDLDYLKKHYPYAGELLLGHLRYGTYGGNSIENIHPFLRQNNWMARNLMLAGNYNITNTQELFEALIDLGQQPKEKSDNVLMLEKIGHFIDEENQRLFSILKSQGYSNLEITEKIKSKISIPKILKRSFKNIDGGFNMVGLVGHGDAFIIRDPAGIRPSHYYVDDEVIVVASERAAIQMAFNIYPEDVHELPPGNALIAKADASYSIEEIIEPTERKSCSFERIYFSRGNDQAIYAERKELGRLLAEPVMEMLDNNLPDTVFSYVPNTASTSFYGLIDGLHEIRHKIQTEALKGLDINKNPEKVDEILSWRPRREKILVKDVKMRTFITNDTDREDLVTHVYDITYGVVKSWKDTLVIMDDSVVRGTTLKTSILRLLDRLEPKRIILVSSAPQIRYPDCYGIDMSKLGDFAAFRAAVELHKENGNESILGEIYAKAVEELKKPHPEQRNVVKDLYANLLETDISKKIAQMVKPASVRFEFDMLFQTVDKLHQACPNDLGDWYFTGDYPTPGGTAVANRSFVYYYEGRKERAY
jgi:amidophosphoribosyltransferase